MLYVTTRNNQDAYTAQRALRENRGPDGGLFVPFRAPHIPQEEIEALAKKPFNQNVAEMLNRLFNTRVTCWDIDLCIGRHGVRLNPLRHRVLMGECWHNLDGQFSATVRNLANLLRSDQSSDALPGEWTWIGIRIAVLFGIFGELIAQGIAAQDKRVDVSMVSGDFSAPMSAWYARAWGLPIGNIVCCCNDNGNLWDFICHGQLRTDGVAIKTTTPEGDIVVPSSLERLIYAHGGVEEVQRYLEAVRRGGSYYLDDKLLHSLRQGIYVTVSSQRRVKDTIPSVYSTHAYLMSSYSALAFAGLQDYRARTGASRHALVLCEKSPACDAETVAAALGVQAKEIKSHL